MCIRDRCCCLSCTSTGSACANSAAKRAADVRNSAAVPPSRKRLTRTPPVSYTHLLAEPGGHFFSEDTLTDQPERVIASEIVREKILRFTDKEIPHGVAVVTESMRDLGNLTEIDATIYCERATHKEMCIRDRCVRLVD